MLFTVAVDNTATRASWGIISGCCRHIKRYGIGIDNMGSVLYIIRVWKITRKMNHIQYNAIQYKHSDASTPHHTHGHQHQRHDQTNT